MKIARETGTWEDERDAKNARNKHSRLVKSSIKEYYTKEQNTAKNKFKSIKELEEKETRTSTSITKMELKLIAQRKLQKQWVTVSSKK